MSCQKMRVCMFCLFLIMAYLAVGEETDSSDQGAKKTIKTTGNSRPRIRLPLTPIYPKALCEAHPGFCPWANAESGPIVDYDKNHPLNVTLYRFGYDYMNITWEMPPDQNNTDLMHFQVYYMLRRFKFLQDRHTNFSVPANTTYTSLQNLEPGTMYSFYIRAVYSTGHKPSSSIISQMTQGYGPDNPCRKQCNPLGTRKVPNPGGVLCNRRTGDCPCVNNKTIGPECGQCIPQYFWHTKVGCEACGCHDGRHTGLCHIDSRGLKVCECQDPAYSGATCSHCAERFFKKQGVCVPCECHGNILNDSRDSCNPETGECIGCAYNTTGFHCERCLDNFYGDPIIAKNCTRISELNVTAARPAHKVTVIMIVCVSLGAFLALLIAFVIYKRCWGHKPQLQFWTIQLRDDHEQVNFAALADQPDSAQYFERNAATHHEDKSPQLRLKTGAYQVLDDGSTEAWVA